MTTIDKTLIKLQELCNALELIKRNHYIPTTSDKEGDVLHSYSVAMLCWYIIEKHNLNLNLEKVLKYALVHDFAEIYAGDTNTFSTKKERADKVVKEKATLTKIETELASFKSLVRTARDYELKKDNESQFVRTVDKIQAWTQGSLDNWRTYKEQEISYDWAMSVIDEQQKSAPPFIKSIFNDIVEFVKQEYPVK